MGRCMDVQGGVGWGGGGMSRTPTWLTTQPCIHQQSTLKISGSGVCERHPPFRHCNIHQAFSWIIFRTMPVSQYFQASLTNASLLRHRAQEMKKPRIPIGDGEYRSFLPGYRYSATSALVSGLPSYLLANVLMTLQMECSNVLHGDPKAIHHFAFGCVNFTHG